MSHAPCSRARGAIGCAALPVPGREVRGVIEYVFARSAHLRAPDVFLTLGSPELPKHPFSILTPHFPAGLRVGDGFSLRERGLWLDAGPIVDLCGLRRYRPAQNIARLAGPAALARTIEAARETARAACDRGGLFPPAPGAAPGRPAASPAWTCGPNGPRAPQAAQSPDRPKDPEELLRGRAGRLAARLGVAASARDWDGFELTARDLAGLGPGLTPSGDDFLAGMLAALRFYGLSGGERVPQAVLDHLAGSAARRTSAFSGFLLRGAAQGLVAEPVCRWLCAVCAGKTRLAAQATLRVLDMGSSSGADTLAGLIAGLTARSAANVCGTREQLCA